MPSSFTLQVLDHNAGEHNHFRVDVIEDLTVGEVQAISDVGRYPCLEQQDGQQWFPFLLEDICADECTKIFVCGKRINRAGSVLLVDLVKPCNASRVVLWSTLPIFTAWIRHISQLDKILRNSKENQSYREKE